MAYWSCDSLKVPGFVIRMSFVNGIFVYSVYGQRNFHLESPLKRNSLFSQTGKGNFLKRKIIIPISDRSSSLPPLHQWYQHQHSVQDALVCWWQCYLPADLVWGGSRNSSTRPKHPGRLVHKMAHGFNIKKCAILTITRKRNPSMYQYTLLNEAIPRTECYKYLGINISKDLRWNTHCQSTLLKASKTLGLLRRTLSPCSKDVKARAYQALVRPQLEYGAEAWNPYSSTTIQRLEQVQKARCTFCISWLQEKHICLCARFKPPLGPPTHTPTTCTIHHAIQNPLQLC